MENESNGLNFRSWKSSPEYSVFFIQPDMNSPSLRTLTCSILLSTKQSMWVARNQTLKYIMGLFCKWVFFFFFALQKLKEKAAFRNPDESYTLLIFLISIHVLCFVESKTEQWTRFPSLCGHLSSPKSSPLDSNC